MTLTKQDVGVFLTEFTQGVRLTQEDLGIQYEESLFNEVANYMVDAGEIDEAVYDHFVSPEGKIRVDAWGGPISEDGVLRLFSIVTAQSDELLTLTKRELEAAFNQLTNFVVKARDARFQRDLDRFRPITELVREICDNWDSIEKIRLCLVTDKKLSQRLDGFKAQVIDDVEVTHSVWDIQRLADFVSSGKGREEIVVSLRDDFGVDVPALKASAASAEYDAYLLVLPGEVVAQIFDRFDTRLLESNVRVFLQARGGVNKGIRDTIEHSPEKFLAFNNGITATAASIEVVGPPSMPTISSITDLQIVNGGQTTASLHAAFRKKVDLSKVFVQVKLSVLGESSDDDLVSDISKYANSQNKVSEADFFSNHPYHKRLEKFSRETFTPGGSGSFVRSKWFYERARGQYLDLLARARSRSRAESEYPKRQLLTKTDHAKFEMTFWGNPHYVSRGAQHNFRMFASEISKLWTDDDSKFDKRHFESSIARAILFKGGEKHISDADWYLNGYRAQAVTYAWSKICFDMQEAGKRLNFEAVWEDQEFPSVVQRQFEEVAREVYEYLFEPVAGIANIGELAKREDCWRRLKALTFDYDEGFVRWCVDIAKPSRRERGKAQVVSRAISYVEKGAPFFQDLQAYCDTEGIQLTDRERGILRYLIQNSGILSDAQARVLDAMFKRVGERLPDRLVP